ncbi:stage V sporulation protein AD [Clostridium sp. AM58-1XD]|uniref:stage V sporulation protein AD n=1 Tax=Clostridium sp. AM58-1XD TaxID=2292307 RepID=UPI000E4D3160|nr:stage V sporulation protein AD [Clostridium sp. AM58-1XD]RGY97135.1 stage V sporulation protein AD [Clostridium sp. AM58-1XD]
MQKGSASLQFEHAPLIMGAASIVGKKEGEGPLGTYFDVVEQDDMFGANSWEEAESAMQKQACELVLEKAGTQKEDVRYLFAGDLLGQLIATSFGTVDLEIPMFGLYGACSTMGEALSLASMTVAAGYADQTVAAASSHFATAEKQFRFPLGYGNQRPFSATWTVTGCGAVVLASEGWVKNRKENDGCEGMGRKPIAKVTGITTGKIVDFGATDSMNMGAAMAPAAYDTINRNFVDFDRTEADYDKIITGDLGEVGRTVLLDFMREQGRNLENVHMDCGIEIYDKNSQDTHAGGSGCGCSATTLCAYILKKIQNKEWKRVLFVPTGALLSTVSFNEGQSIPGIAHGVVIESAE